jgi:hypothetical protein
VIAVIADIARDRKGKTLPLINTDWTDQHGSERGWPEPNRQGAITRAPDIS